MNAKPISETEWLSQDGETVLPVKSTTDGDGRPVKYVVDGESLILVSFNVLHHAAAMTAAQAAEQE